MVVKDNQGLCVTIDSGGTAQTHGGTRTEVTRVGHDVETGNLTLQGLIDGLEGKSFHIVHLEVLDCTSVLTGRNLQACCGCHLLAGDSHLCHGFGVIDKRNFEHTLAASNLLAELLVANIGNLQRIVGVLDIHGKVTVHISDSLADNTVVLIYLLDVGTDDYIYIVRNGT